MFASSSRRNNFAAEDHPSKMTKSFTSRRQRNALSRRFQGRSRAAPRLGVQHRPQQSCVGGSAVLLIALDAQPKRNLRT